MAEETIVTVRTLMTQLEVDYEKAKNGNRSAAVRARKAASAIAKQMKQVREDIQTLIGGAADTEAAE